MCDVVFRLLVFACVRGIPGTIAPPWMHRIALDVSGDLDLLVIMLLKSSQVTSRIRPMADTRVEKVCPPTPSTPRPVPSFEEALEVSMLEEFALT